MVHVPRGGTTPVDKEEVIHAVRHVSGHVAGHAMQGVAHHVQDLGKVVARINIDPFWVLVAGIHVSVALFAVIVGVGRRRKYQ